MRESQIQDAFAAWLRKNRIAFIQARRDRKSTIKEGAQDFTIYHVNKSLLIETKTLTGKLSPAQVKHIDETRQHSGMIVHVCRSIEECIAVTRAWLGTDDPAPNDAGPIPQRLKLKQWQGVTLAILPDGSVRLATPAEIAAYA